jgi:phospholipid-transporting ATPase
VKTQFVKSYFFIQLTHICLFLPSSHFWPSLPLAANMAGMSHMLLSSPVFWWGLILAPVTALLSDFSIKT